MIHSIYTMTIGRYGQLDRTQDARLMRRWFNPFPVKWFKGRIDRFFESVRELFTDDGVNNQLQDEIERTYMVNKMLQLSILYDALYACLVLKAGIDITLLLLNREPRPVPNLEYYKQQVMELTGIEINDYADLLKLRAEMTRMSDKFAERFPSEKELEDKPSFYRAAIRVFAALDMGYNERMTLAEFAELKKEAEDRLKRLQKKQDDGAIG